MQEGCVLSGTGDNEKWFGKTGFGNSFVSVKAHQTPKQYRGNNLGFH